MSSILIGYLLKVAFILLFGGAIIWVMHKFFTDLYNTLDRLDKRIANLEEVNKEE